MKMSVKMTKLQEEIEELMSYILNHDITSRDFEKYFNKMNLLRNEIERENKKQSRLKKISIILNE